MMRGAWIAVTCLAASAGAQTPLWHHGSCPLPTGAVGYPVTASSPAVHPSMLLAIARAAASAWPSDTVLPVREQPVGVADLTLRLPRAMPHRRHRWWPASGDTATVTLRYTRGADVGTIVDTNSVFARKLEKALAVAVMRARLGHVQLDTLPLRIDGVDSADVVLRFGYEPRAGDAVTRYAIMESQIGPGRNAMGPTYPARLRSRQLPGQVLVAFIVMPDGSVPPDGLRILRSTHLEFSSSVRDFLRRTTLAPATIDCRPVVDLARQPFNFTMSPHLPPGATIVP